MIIENPEYIMGTSIDGSGVEQPVSVVLPKGLPGKTRFNRHVRIMPSGLNGMNGGAEYLGRSPLVYQP